MSSYLDTLKSGDFVELMGPIGNFKYSDENFTNLDSIGMIGAGTGITPLFQIIQHVLTNSEHKKPKIKLVYANNTLSDVLLGESLELWAKLYPDRFQLIYLLMQLPSLVPNNSVPLEEGLISAKIVQKYFSDTGVNLVCGPVAMEEATRKIFLSCGISEERIFFFTKSDQKSEGLVNQKNVVHESSEVNEYTMEEVSKHSTPKDCWMVISGKVYNVSKFVDEHPGGEIILEGAGKDATQLFEEDFPHSRAAVSQLRDYVIGILRS
eukprot:TRINITY_DN8568_c0_g1_i7.p1 TRINITY_DN8568_c0_g1~~TRINITY_DN8568_c0_g1_i7.p1  ORF type:complete len:265 (+),score=62.33 TRINITY_DN8568_c0_g1_i7:512-1306(+)